MAVSFTLHQTTEIVDGPKYRAKSEIVATDGSDPGAFVFRVSDKEFDHFANARDMASVPFGFDQAVVMGFGFYRDTTLCRTWPSAEGALRDLGAARRRVQNLANDLTAFAGSFPIDQTVVLTGED